MKNILIKTATIAIILALLPIAVVIGGARAMYKSLTEGFQAILEIVRE